ncbi:hypothetical protein HCU64_09855 [Methylobacterium sp. C25]|uniref:hypothetical protein n=1 Tax=Methylobacterium sp. C25 TaxID=2721622 RepID=UPI001F39F9C7|nr:hypothetical protein [Methylobacterium sp. C25]MCE4224055.1 hypothetical protein [Methylobacterium sp. C25]
MAGHGHHVAGEVGGSLMGALLAVDAGVRARREQQAWARADAAAENAVHALGQRLLRAQARERELLQQIAALHAEAQAQRVRACRAEGRLVGLQRRSAA